MKATKKDCVGCFRNHYNTEGTQCRFLKDAKMVKRKAVHINQMPPWNQEPIKVPDCYGKQGYIFVDPKRTC